jgi:DNA-binding Lrp family transcriptional regulator
MSKITKKDFIILSHFRQNARCRLTKLSRATGVPVSTLFDKLNGYQDTIVHRTVSLLNFGALGFSTRANILLSVDGKDKPNLKQHLLSHISVNSLYRVNNGYDFMAECIFRDIKELEEFVDQTRAQYTINKHEVFYVVDDLKREAFLADPNLVDLLLRPSPAA